MTERRKNGIALALAYGDHLRDQTEPLKMIHEQVDADLTDILRGNWPI